MTNKMAIVKITSYTRNRGAAKATVRYITHRPGKDGRETVAAALSQLTEKSQNLTPTK